MRTGWRALQVHLEDCKTPQAGLEQLMSDSLRKLRESKTGTDYRDRTSNTRLVQPTLGQRPLHAGVLLDSLASLTLLGGELRETLVYPKCSKE